MSQSRRQQGLYSPAFEHDNCGIGAVVNIKGEKSHQIVADALRIVEHLEHRAGKDAEGRTGDGVGILTPVTNPASASVESGNTAWVCSFSHRTS